jgi:Uma2 family endonuclease
MLAIADREGRLFELVDGTLVEKALGAYESVVAGLILHFIYDYLEINDIGQALGEAAALRILSRQTRIPDVSFVTWERKGKGKLPKVPRIVPNLAVEVLSEGNTDPEMERKLREYFEAGVELVWYVDPETRTARVFTSLTALTNIGEDGVLEGGNVLPGLRISLRDLFARADADGPRSK